MDESAFIALVAEILEVDVDSVSMTAELEAIEWDSLANLTFIAEIDTKLGVALDADALAEAKTVADLHHLVASASNAQ